MRIQSLIEKSPPQAFWDPGLSGFTHTPLHRRSLHGETPAGICHIRADNGDGWSIVKTGVVGPKGAGGKWICRQKKDLWIPGRGIPLSLGYMPGAGGRQDIYHEHADLTWQDSTSYALYRLKIQIGRPAGSGSGRPGCISCPSHRFDSGLCSLIFVDLNTFTFHFSFAFWTIYSPHFSCDCWNNCNAL